MTTYVLCSTKEEAQKFCRSRGIKQAKLVQKPEDWPGEFLSEDWIIPLNSFFTMPDWKSVYDAMPEGYKGRFLTK